jgi:hypothetical protein
LKFCLKTHSAFVVPIEGIQRFSFAFALINQYNTSIQYINQSTSKQMKQSRSIHLLIQLVSVLLVTTRVTAFSLVPPSIAPNVLSSKANARLSTTVLHEVQIENAEIVHHSVQDGQGRPITVGTIVRIAVDGLKAYQIAPKGQGSYNAQKEFVAGSKYLVLPVGLRGVVQKVYDIDNVSANFPVQVKFEPGQHTEEGFDPPTAFLMHFLEAEVECV